MASKNPLSPVATDDVFNFRQGESFGGNLLANDKPGANGNLAIRNVNGDTIAASGKAPSTVTVDGTYGTFVVKADGSFTYALKAEYANSFDRGETFTDSLYYKVSDGSGNTDYATAKINISALKPLAVDDTFDFSLGNAAQVYNVLANDKGPAGGDLFLRSITDEGQHFGINAKQGLDQETQVVGEYGTFKFKPNGTFTYDINETAAAKIAGGATLVETLDYYKISDGAGNTDVATITLNLHNTGDFALV